MCNGCKHANIATRALGTVWNPIEHRGQMSPANSGVQAGINLSLRITGTPFISHCVNRFAEDTGRLSANGPVGGSASAGPKSGSLGGPA